ncbi:hypothetical protein LSH36_1596g00023, partial [Paralvinella palmiformis]
GVLYANRSRDGYRSLLDPQPTQTTLSHRAHWKPAKREMTFFADCLLARLYSSTFIFLRTEVYSVCDSLSVIIPCSGISSRGVSIDRSEEREMAGEGCLKCIIIVLNIIFGLVGISFLGAGLYVKFGADDVLEQALNASFSSLEGMLGDFGTDGSGDSESVDLGELVEFLSPVITVLIIFGAFLLLMVILGSVGVCCKVQIALWLSCYEKIWAAIDTIKPMVIGAIAVVLIVQLLCVIAAIVIARQMSKSNEVA